MLPNLCSDSCTAEVQAVQGGEVGQGRGNVPHGIILQSVPREGEGRECVLTVQGLAERGGMVGSEAMGGEV